MLQSKRTIFIGDIQGCYTDFKALLKKLKITKNDRVFLVGDLINKGPDSYKVLKFMSKNNEQFKSVLGNHEVNFLRWLNGEKYEDNKELKRLIKKIKKKGREDLIEYIKLLPLYIKEDDFILLHGGKIPGKKLSEHTIDEITRLREYEGEPWYLNYKGKTKIIYGHWAFDGVRIRDNTIGLDSGCCYGKALTAYILETGEIIQQSSSNIYANVYINQDYISGFKNKISNFLKKFKK